MFLFTRQDETKIRLYEKSYTDILGEIASTVAQAVASIRRPAVLAWALTQGNGLKELSLLNKDETAEFGTKTEGKNCTNKQNIFPFGCHLHITSICKKKIVYITETVPKNRQMLWRKATRR